MKKILLILLLSLPFITLAQVANDACSNAIVLTVNSSTDCTTTQEGTLEGATNETELLSCSTNIYSDVWYEFTATNQYHYITLDANNSSLGIAVYEGCPGEDIPLFCEVEHELNCPTLESGTTYKIRIYGTISNPDFSICVSTYPNVVSVSESQYTVEEIITDVLLSSETIAVSNITYSTGTSTGVNGIGYFNNNEGNFPFPQGLVLSTGSINNISGPNNSTFNTDSQDWLGDDGLADYINDYEGNVSNEGFYNASVIEFDFVPLTNYISFEFIFASEEYGIYQCTYSDCFAIFLNDVTESEAVNIATIPGTTIPVGSETIRDSAYNTGCASANSAYFDSYNVDIAGSIIPGIPVNFNGITTPITAQAPVIPGNTYHLKLVISDRADSVFDTAVFINSEDFNLGTESGNFIVYAPEGNALQLFSEGETLADFNVDGENIQWYDSETSTLALPESTLLIDGQIYYATQNINDIESTERLAITAFLVSPNNLVICDQDMDGFELFDLSTNHVEIIDGLEPISYYVGYYLTYEDAVNETNPIQNPLFTNTIPYLQTIYIRLSEFADTLNYAIAEFELQAQSGLEITIPGDITDYGATIVDLTVHNAIILSNLTPIENYTISFYTTETDAYAATPEIQNPETYGVTDGQIIWIRVEHNETGCFSITFLTIYTVVPAPTGGTDQDFTEGETLANLEVEGENIQWYETETDDTPLAMSISLIDETTYYATQTINSTESINRLAVTAHQVLGFEEQIFTAFNYYPNPVNNVLTLSNANTISKIEVYNLLGQQIANKDFDSTTVHISLLGLESGIYLVKITSLEQQKTIKIQKQ